MKIIHLSKRAELQIETHLDKEMGSLFFKFTPFPMIGIKRFGGVANDEQTLIKGSTSFHLMWLFFELTLDIDDK